LALGATILGVLLGEAGLRLLGLPRGGPFLQEFYGSDFKLMAYDSNPSGAFDLDLDDPALRARVAARLADPEEFLARWRATPHAVGFEFNAQGFRERKLGPKVARTRRIAVVGDSFTVGHGLPNELSYPRLLEARLAQERSDSGDRIEVLNLGRGAIDLPAIERVAEFTLHRLEPDVLVYGYFMNDPLPSVGRDLRTPVHDMLDAGWVSLQQTPSMARIGQSQSSGSRVLDLVRRFFADRKVAHSTIEWYQRLHEPEAWKPTLDRIVAMSQAARDRDVRFVLLLLPLPFEIAHSPFAEAHRKVQQAASEAGIEVIDALPALARFDDDELRLHPRDRHPSPLYTRVVADVLAPALSGDAPLPAASRRHGNTGR
jgi:hypothetical protein